MMSEVLIGLLLILKIIIFGIVLLVINTIEPFALK